MQLATYAAVTCQKGNGKDQGHQAPPMDHMGRFPVVARLQQLATPQAGLALNERPR